MVTEEKICNAALARYHLGSVFIWLGGTVMLVVNYFLGQRRATDEKQKSD